MEQADKEFKDLNHDEILDIIHSDHITAEQLNIFASNAKHLTALKKKEVEKLAELLEKIEARLREIESAS
jgi:translation elongation factor EF-Tu-like GTPase